MEVNITKRIDTPEGRRFCAVILSPNGRIKPDWVVVDERQEKHPEGAITSTGPKTVSANAWPSEPMRPPPTTV